MKFFLFLSFFIFSIQHAFASNVSASRISNANQISSVKLNEEKPWSIKMGISTIDTTRSANQLSEGKGVSINIQREILNRFELGMAFTNYTLKFKNQNELSNGNLNTQLGQENHFSIFDVYAEYTAVNVDFYDGFSFKGAVDVGGSYDSSIKDKPYFYGIGMLFEYNRQIGLRADLKTYLSRSNTNTVSLVGYF